MFRILVFSALRRRPTARQLRREQLREKIHHLWLLSPAAAHAVEDLVDDMIHDEEARQAGALRLFGAGGGR